MKHIGVCRAPLHTIPKEVPIKAVEAEYELSESVDGGGTEYAKLLNPQWKLGSSASSQSGGAWWAGEVGQI